MIAASLHILQYISYMYWTVDQWHNVVEGRSHTNRTGSDTCDVCVRLDQSNSSAPVHQCARESRWPMNTVVLRSMSYVHPPWRVQVPSTYKYDTCATPVFLVALPASTIAPLVVYLYQVVVCICICIHNIQDIWNTVCVDFWSTVYRSQSVVSYRRNEFMETSELWSVWYTSYMQAAQLSTV